MFIRSPAINSGASSVANVRIFRCFSLGRRPAKRVHRGTQPGRQKFGESMRSRIGGSISGAPPRGSHNARARQVPTIRGDQRDLISPCSGFAPPMFCMPERSCRRCGNIAESTSHVRSTRSSSPSVKGLSSVLLAIALPGALSALRQIEVVRRIQRFVVPRRFPRIRLPGVIRATAERPQKSAGLGLLKAHYGSGGKNVPELSGYIYRLISARELIGAGLAGLCRRRTGPFTVAAFITVWTVPGKSRRLWLAAQHVRDVSRRIETGNCIRSISAGPQPCPRGQSQCSW